MGISTQIKLVQKGETREIHFSRKAMARWDSRLERTNQELQKLIISFSGLSSVSDTLGTFKKLTHLNLSGNRLSLLPSMNMLQNLIFVDLSFNRLDSFPVGITNCKNLITLDMGGNRLTFVPTKVTSLSALKVFYLNNNLITELPDEFCELKELRTVSLRSNLLKKLPESLGQLSNLRRLYLQDNKLSLLPESIIDCPLNEKFSACQLAKNSLVDHLGKPYEKNGIQGIFDTLVADGLLEAHKQFFTREEKKLASTFLDGKTRTLIKNKQKQAKFQETLGKLRTQSRDTITRYNSTGRHATLNNRLNKAPEGLNTSGSQNNMNASSMDRRESAIENESSQNENKDEQNEDGSFRSRNASVSSERSVRRLTTLQRKERSGLGQAVQQDDSFNFKNTISNVNPTMGLPMLNMGIPTNGLQPMGMMGMTAMPMMIVQSVFDPVSKQMKYLFPGPDGQLRLVGMNQVTPKEDSDEEYFNDEEDDDDGHLEFSNLFQALPEDVQDKFEFSESLGEPVDINRVAPSLLQDSLGAKNMFKDYKYNEYQNRSELIPVINPNDRRNIKNNLEQSLQFKNSFEELNIRPAVKRVSLNTSLNRKSQLYMNAPPPPMNMPAPPTTPLFDPGKKSLPEQTFNSGVNVNSVRKPVPKAPLPASMLFQQTATPSMNAPFPPRPQIPIPTPAPPITSNVTQFNAPQFSAPLPPVPTYPPVFTIPLPPQFNSTRPFNQSKESLNEPPFFEPPVFAPVPPPIDLPPLPAYKKSELNKSANFSPKTSEEDLMKMIKDLNQMAVNPLRQK